MKGVAIKVVVVLALVAFGLGGAWGCGKKAPPKPPDEQISAVVLPVG